MLKRGRKSIRICRTVLNRESSTFSDVRSVYRPYAAAGEAIVNGQLKRNTPPRIAVDGPFLKTQPHLAPPSNHRMLPPTGGLVRNSQTFFDARFSLREPIPFLGTG